MKRVVFVILVVFLCASCAPSPEVIQAAISQTQTAAAMLVPTSTTVPTRTPTSRPVPTNMPAPNYYIEYGFCIMGVTYSSGNPDDTAGCGPNEREQVYIGTNQYLEVEFNEVNDRQNYCALFKVDGTFVMADVDTTASGKVICKP